MLIRVLRHHGMVTQRFLISASRYYSSHETETETQFDRLILNITNSVNLTDIPRSKEDALNSMVRKYINGNGLLNEKIDVTKELKKDEYLNILEKDDSFIISDMLKHLKKTNRYNKDDNLIEKRKNLERLDPPLNVYAIFLKYIYEKVPDIQLIEKYYDSLPRPLPLYIKQTHFDHFMEILLNTDNTGFFLKVISNLKQLGCDLTVRERSKLISNAFRVGQSPPLDTYQYIKLRINLDDVKLYNGILQYCALSQSNEDLFGVVLKDMLNSKVKLTCETYVLIMQYFAKSRQNEENIVILLELLCKDDTFSFDILTINSLISHSYILGREKSTLRLIGWLMDMTAMKGHMDSNFESQSFLGENSDLIGFLKKNLNLKSKLLYLPNFDEETADICLKNSLKSAGKTGNINDVMRVLDILYEYNLVLRESTYKRIFSSLHELDQRCFSLKEVQKITGYLMDSHQKNLPLIFANHSFRKLILDSFRKQSPNRTFFSDINGKERYIALLFDEFYRKYPEGFRSRGLDRRGSSKLYTIIMNDTIEEFRELVNWNGGPL